jgi:hypothetical protein
MQLLDAHWLRAASRSLRVRRRLFHHEYPQAFAASPFTLRSLRPETDPVGEQLERVLRFRHPRERQLAVTNREAILGR